MDLHEGEWARVITSTGSMLGRIVPRNSMPPGLVRVPHGWWKPESRPGLEDLSGMWSFCDAQITADDDPDLIDLEQGVPHLKGTPYEVSGDGVEFEAVELSLYGRSSL